MEIVIGIIMFFIVIVLSMVKIFGQLSNRRTKDIEHLVEKKVKEEFEKKKNQK